ncbi:MAG: NAD-dependent epimerase/dehydratase family protein [Novosphingobium sp.]|nr:NAD-dependent epimerase/dehydratase family protein [Novosphingobium sp.]
MKVLMVGGAGFIGSHVSLFFHDLGHDVTIMSRSKPKGQSRLNDLRFVATDYINDDCSDGRLEGYEWLVFCAGNDLGNYPRDGSVSQADYFEKSNIEALPRFFENARQAGISRAVYMGSFYSFVAPDSIETIPYVRSRHLSDAAVRAISSPDFTVCSCALPWIVGYTPGLTNMHWEALAKGAAGVAEWPDFVPPGGGNFMTCRSVAQAMLGGLERGESGKSYLVGDVNMTWADFYGLWYEAAGNPRTFAVRDDEHPILAREIIAYLGGRTPDYEPPAEETALLGYDRGVLLDEVKACYEYYSRL